MRLWKMEKERQKAESIYIYTQIYGESAKREYRGYGARAQETGQ